MQLVPDSPWPWPTTDLLLFLIGEELKSRKCFAIFRQAGFDHSLYEPHLDDLILALAGLDDNENATLDYYYHVMERHCMFVEPAHNNLAEVAKQVLRMLEEYGRGRDME